MRRSLLQMMAEPCPTKDNLPKPGSPTYLVCSEPRRHRPGRPSTYRSERGRNCGRGCQPERCCDDFVHLRLLLRRDFSCQVFQSHLGDGHDLEPKDCAFSIHGLAFGEKERDRARAVPRTVFYLRSQRSDNDRRHDAVSNVRTNHESRPMALLFRPSPRAPIHPVNLPSTNIVRDGWQQVRRHACLWRSDATSLGPSRATPEPTPRKLPQASTQEIAAALNQRRYAQRFGFQLLLRNTRTGPKCPTRKIGSAWALPPVG